MLRIPRSGDRSSNRRERRFRLARKPGGVRAGPRRAEMGLEVFREFRFESAHWLPNVSEGHKCRRLHGHSFRVDVHVRGPVDSERGWIVDFADIDAAFAPIHEEVDHHCLNEVAGLENPTSEQLAQWIWQRLATRLPGLARLVVRETCDSGCIYDGP